MSDEMIIDLSNYKDRVGTRVLPGKYRVLVEDAESTESSNKNPMINLWFKVIGGEYDGATITDRLVLTEKSLFRVVGFMQGIGLPTPKKRLKINIRQFVGRQLEVDIDDGEPYNGRIRSEVRGYNKVASAPSAGTDLPDADADATPAATDQATTALGDDSAPAQAAQEAGNGSSDTAEKKLQQAAESVVTSDQSATDDDGDVDLDSVDL